MLIPFCLLLCMAVIPFLGQGSIFGAGPALTLSFDSGSASVILPDGETVYGIHKEGLTYFFLPSYLKAANLNQSSSPWKILVDGSPLKKLSFNREIPVEIEDGNGGRTPWAVAFYHSENLSSVCITLDDYSPEDIDHDIYSPASVRVISPSGEVDYAGGADQIKGRGNSTWDEPKNPYSLKLASKISLCGMRPSRKWVLLSNYYDGTRLRNKLVLDTQEAVGMEYASQSEWVDVYLNGIYYGNYLLCEKIEADKTKLDIGDLEDLNEQAGPVSEQSHVVLPDRKGYRSDASPSDISGGYLLEYTRDVYYEKHPCGFFNDRLVFTIREPNNATLDEVDYIRSCVEDLDGLFREAEKDYPEGVPYDPDRELFSRIDYDSFVKRFLTEEFFYNSDAAVTSWYFHKKVGDDRIYAGPGWDYDNTCGQNFIYYEGSLLDDAFFEGRTALNWDRILFSSPQKNEALKKAFREMLPVFEKVITEKIDEYAEEIRSSVRMDELRWGLQEDHHYRSAENETRYIKDFLARRLQFLCNRWDCSSSVAQAPGNGQVHTVIFETPEGQVSVSVNDFEPVPEDQIPPFDPEQYSGWYPVHSNDVYSPRLPILEDTTYVLK